MAKGSVAVATTAKDKAVNILADLNFTTLVLPRWSKDKDVVGDRRCKLVEKLNHQKAILAPDYERPTTRSGKAKKESWFIFQPNGSLVFFVRWAHSQLEFVPGMKGITTSLTDLPAVIDKLIAATNQGVFDQQMADLSNAVAQKITGGRKNSASAANKKAA